MLQEGSIYMCKTNHMLGEGMPATAMASMMNAELGSFLAWDSNEAVDGDSCISGCNAAPASAVSRSPPGAGHGSSVCGSTGCSRSTSVAPPAFVTAAAAWAGLSVGNASVAAGDGALRQLAHICHSGFYLGSKQSGARRYMRVRAEIAHYRNNERFSRF